MSRALVSFKACPFPLSFVGPARAHRRRLQPRFGCQRGAQLPRCVLHGYFCHAPFVLFIFISSFFTDFASILCIFAKKGVSYRRIYSPATVVQYHSVPQVPYGFWAHAFQRIRHASYFVLHHPSTLQQTLNHHEQYATLSLTNLRDTRLRLIAPQCPYA